MRPPNTGAIDQAEAYLIANPGVTIPLAAQVFGLTVNSIRSRIEHKYGSLAEARLSGPAPQRVRKPVRRCMCCRRSTKTPAIHCRCCCMRCGRHRWIKLS